jgi:hypothetical protein
MLNQRAITDALMAHGYSKAKFLNWVDKYSKFLEKDKEMIHDILDSWVEPEVTLSGDSNSSAKNTNNTTANTNVDETDFDSVFGTDGDESDSDLFGTTTNATQSAAKISAADVRNNIKNLDFTL